MKVLYKEMLYPAYTTVTFFLENLLLVAPSSVAFMSSSSNSASALSNKFVILSTSYTLSIKYCA